MAEKSSEGAKADVRLASPHEHAVALGSHRTRKLQPGAVVAAIGGGTPSLEEYSWQHAAAAGLHGWTEHAHHAGEPIQITADAYKAALLAATTPVTRATADFDKEVSERQAKELGLKSRVVMIAKGDDIRDHKLDSHKAAAIGVPTHTDYEPHPAALSEYSAYAIAKKAAAEAEAEAEQNAALAATDEEA